MVVVPTDQHLVYDEAGGLWIRYPTISDALVATMMLEHKVPSTTINLFLQTIRHSDFDSSKVTFKDAVEIDGYVTDQRRDRAVLRSSMHSDTAGMPAIALDAVVESVAEEMCSLYQELALRPSAWALANKERRRMLAEMSLVHRSWTAKSQCILRRTVLLGNVAHLQSFVRSPLCGPYVREIGYCSGIPQKFELRRAKTLADYLHHSEDCEILASILSRTAALRFFSCSLSIETTHSLHCFYRMLDCLEGNTGLKGVCLGIGGQSNSDVLVAVDKVCWTVSKLSNLTFLSLGAEGSDCVIPPCSPPPSLKALDIKLNAHLSAAEMALYSWLLTPREGFVLKTLIISITVYDGELDHANFIQFFDTCKCLGALEDLQCQIEGFSTERKLMALIQQLLSGCSSLTSLFLPEFYLFSFRHGVPSRLVLPPLLRDLYIELYNTDMDESEDLPEDKALNLLLADNARLPLFRSIVLGGARYISEFSEGMDMARFFPLAAGRCTEDGIVFRWSSEISDHYRGIILRTLL